MTVLIPAYEPDEKLLQLVKEIREKSSYNIVVVNDGSGEEYFDIFIKAKNLGCKVLSYLRNKVKGYALKVGFRYIMENGEKDGVVCADCDGQHTVNDIIKVAEQVMQNNDCIILGSRKFVSKVPLKNLFGNIFTKISFFLTTGISIKDTQTGLRGYKPYMLESLCDIKGNRYEYELNILLETPKNGYGLYEVMIDTIYIDNNKSSHFRPVFDSARIYLPLIKFGLSSLSSAIIDFALLFVFYNFTASLLFSVVSARVCSSIFNYIANKNLVFAKTQNDNLLVSAVKYFSLVLFILSCNYGLMFLFTNVLSLPLIAAKLITEFTLFFASYIIQKKIIFSENPRKHSTNKII